MKRTFVILAADGRFASYDMKSGPFLTDVFALSYTWETRGDAEKQRPLYEQAFGVPLTVTEWTPTPAVPRSFVQGDPSLS